MFRDKKEELARLEAALLAEEPTREAQDLEPEETLAEDDFAAFADQPDYEAYNTDLTDEDLDCYSEAVRQPQRSNRTSLWAVILLLLAGIVCVLGWWILRYGGFL